MSNIFSRSLHSSGKLLNSTVGSASIKSIDLSPFKLVPKSNLYATIRIFNKPYLITAGDRLTLPHNLKDVEVGNTIKFNDIVSLGSRDYVFYPPSHGTEELDKLVSIQGVIIEKTKEKARTKLVENQRCRKDSRTLVKHKKTVIRITDLTVKV